MNALTDYKRNKSKIKKNNQPYINSLIENINNSFELSPSYFQVTKNDNLNTFYDVWILDEDSYKKDIGIKKVIIKPNQTLDKGEYINWNNQKWLCTKKDPQVQYCDNGLIEMCNNTLKWIGSNGVIQETPCIIQNRRLNGDGLNEGNSITTLDTEKSLIIPNNSLTKELEEEQRLLFNKNKRYCYKISQINGLIAPGLLHITLTSTAYDPSIDDLENNLCNINKLAVYEIRILSTNPSSINVGKSMGLQVELLKNGVVVTDSSILSEITYVSDNVNVATVDNNGLITGVSEGNCNITAQYNGVSVSISINVINVVIPDIVAYDLTPTASMGYVIKKGNTNTFTCHKYNNGVEVVTTFDFDINYNALSNTVISIVEKTETCIKIKNLSVDTVTPYKTIFVLYKERGQVGWLSKEITLKGLFG